MSSKKPKKKESLPTPNNVILFPPSKSFTTDITVEQIKANKEAIQQIHIEETIEIVTPFLFDNIQSMGFELSKRPQLSKDINLIIESINSLLRTYYDMDHPLQDTATQIFNVMSDLEKEEQE